MHDRTRWQLRDGAEPCLLAIDSQSFAVKIEAPTCEQNLHKTGRPDTAQVASLGVSLAEKGIS
jgi:hypothetical protein